MHAARSLLTTAVVALFLVEAQRAFFASMFALGVGALFPELRLARALFALLPFAALLAPMVPLPRWIGRDGALVLTAVAAALVRVPMTLPDLWTRLVGSALVLGLSWSFLAWAVGHVERRLVAGGVVLGLVVDQLLRLGGASYDLSLQPPWLPIQAVVSLGVIVLVISGVRDGFGAPGDEGLERRAGALRLRGALALGSLLFLDLHVVGLTAAAARWTGVGYPALGIAVGVAGAAALLITLRAARPTLSRATTLTLVGLVLAAALGAFWFRGWGPALAVAAAHGAVLVLISRAIDPSSGRRGGTTATAGALVFAALGTLFILTFYAAFTIPALDEQVPWVLALAGVVLAGSFILQPRPGPLERSVSIPAAAALSAAVGATAVTLGLWVGATTPEPPDRLAAESSGDGATELRVLTWNIHFGFDESWRYDPAAIADGIARASPDVAGLQEVVAGGPTAYGVDLAFWLGRRLGMRSDYSAAVGGLLGAAMLTRVGGRFDALQLPPGGGDRKQMLRLRLSDPRVAVHSVHLGVRESARGPQLDRVLEAVEPGPAVMMGDLNDTTYSPVTERLRRAGFRDVFDSRGTPGPTYPAVRPDVRIDWIWVRGLRVHDARVLPGAASDHRAVAATLHTRDGGIRSTGIDDLQEFER